MRYTREEACLAWLTHGGLPCDGLHALLESASAEAIYERFTEDRSFMKAYAPRECIMELARHAPPAAMHEMLVTMQAHDMHVMHMGDARYPALLREISDPPAILFYAGDPSCLHDPCVTMVGTRNASAHGLRTAHDVARDLAKAGVTVVSGFAVGVDSACHTGCMDGGGRTAAVLGCGLDVAYPAGSEALRRRILDTGGVLLTEFPPGAPPSGWHFPVRNRILSGLSRATIMMECRERSGSMNTVQHALDQGREVYAYPGRTGTPAASGAHILLREGANFFSFASDIIDDLCLNRRAAGASPPISYSQEQMKILAALTAGECTLEQLAALTGLDEKTVAGEITLLQLHNLIRSTSGGSYART